MDLFREMFSMACPQTLYYYFHTIYTQLACSAEEYASQHIHTHIRADSCGSWIFACMCAVRCMNYVKRASADMRFMILASSYYRLSYSIAVERVRRRRCSRSANTLELDWRNAACFHEASQPHQKRTTTTTRYTQTLNTFARLVVQYRVDVGLVVVLCWFFRAGAMVVLQKH